MKLFYHLSSFMYLHVVVLVVFSNHLEETTSISSSPLSPSSVEKYYNLLQEISLNEYNDCENKVDELMSLFDDNFEVCLLELNGTLSIKSDDPLAIGRCLNKEEYKQIN